MGEDDRLGSGQQQEVGDLALAIIAQQLHQLGEEKGHLRTMSSVQHVISTRRPSLALHSVHQIRTAPFEALMHTPSARSSAQDSHSVAVPHA